MIRSAGRELTESEVPGSKMAATTKKAEAAEPDYTSEHPPISEEGWTLIHSALRLDLEDTRVALDRMMSSGGGIEEWEWSDLTLWWNHVSGEIKLHHLHEEKYFFPAIYERCCESLKERFTHSHDELLKNVDDVTAAIKTATEAKDPTLLAKANSTLAKLSDDMLPHLQEEEDEMLPLFRKHFKKSEVDGIMKPMIDEFDWHELPHFVRQWQSSPTGKTPEDLIKCRAYITSSLGMPGFVYDYVVGMPGLLERYDNEFVGVIVELKDPSLRPKVIEKKLNFENRSCCTIA